MREGNVFWEIESLLTYMHSDDRNTEHLKQLTGKKGFAFGMHMKTRSIYEMALVKSLITRSNITDILFRCRDAIL